MSVWVYAKPTSQSFSPKYLQHVALFLGTSWYKLPYAYPMSSIPLTVYEQAPRLVFVSTVLHIMKLVRICLKKDRRKIERYISGGKVRSLKKL